MELSAKVFKAKLLIVITLYFEEIVLMIGVYLRRNICNVQSVNAVIN